MPYFCGFTPFEKYHKSNLIISNLKVRVKIKSFERDGWKMNHVLLWQFGAYFQGILAVSFRENRLLVNVSHHVDLLNWNIYSISAEDRCTYSV